MLKEPRTLGRNHDSLVNKKLEPLQQYLGLTEAELKKIVLKEPSILGYNHANLVTKLALYKKLLAMTDEGLKQAVLKEPSCLNYGQGVEEKWELMRNGFVWEAGQQQQMSLRMLGVGKERLEERLGELEALLGEKPRATPWLHRLVVLKPEKWREVVPGPDAATE